MLLLLMLAVPCVTVEGMVTQSFQRQDPYCVVHWQEQCRFRV
jgi:hypothetical protein